MLIWRVILEMFEKKEKTEYKVRVFVCVKEEEGLKEKVKSKEMKKR